MWDVCEFLAHSALVRIFILINSFNFCLINWRFSDFSSQGFLPSNPKINPKKENNERADFWSNRQMKIKCAIKLRRYQINNILIDQKIQNDALVLNFEKECFKRDELLFMIQNKIKMIPKIGLKFNETGLKWRRMKYRRPKIIYDRKNIYDGGREH